MMTLLNNLSVRNNTHKCPSCNDNTYCSMLDGKSASTCWCMNVSAKGCGEQGHQIPTYEMYLGDLCMCKGCLTGK